MMLEIPIQGGAVNAHQTFSATLGGREITFKLDFMSYAEVPSWSMELYENERLIIAGIVLRCGCDMLAPYQLGLGALIMTGEEPTLDNLGVRNTLIWASEDEKI